MSIWTRHAWVGQKQEWQADCGPLNATAVEVLKRQVGKHPERVFTYFGKPLRWQHACVGKGVETGRHRELPLARHAAYVGDVAPPVGDAHP